MTAVAPSCHPSHTAMLTGLYPHQVGIPLCGEDLIFKPADLGDPVDGEALLEVQDLMSSSPLPLVHKKTSAVMNWLKIPDDVATLATHLRSLGYVTAGFPAIWTIHGRQGYARGFDIYDDSMPHYYGPRALAFLLRDVFKSQRRRHGEETLELVTRFLDRHDNSTPLFLFVHFADTHVPYRASPGVDFSGETAAERAALEAHRAARYPVETLERAMQRMEGPGEDSLLDAYDRSIRHVDSLIERLFALLEARGLLDTAFVVITADHGDSFGQHAYLSGAQAQGLFFEHSVYVWEETQHVPLLLYDPSSREPARRRTDDVSTVDIVPTILGAVGQSKVELGAGDLPGRDLILEEHTNTSRRVYFLTFGRGRPGLLRTVLLDYPRLVGFREGDVKFFVDRDRFRGSTRGRCFLYDLASDPDERANLCDDPAHDVRAERFRLELVSWYNDIAGARQQIGHGEEGSAPGK